MSESGRKVKQGVKRGKFASAQPVPWGHVRSHCRSEPGKSTAIRFKELELVAKQRKKKQSPRQGSLSGTQLQAEEGLKSAIKGSPRPGKGKGNQISSTNPHAKVPCVNLKNFGTPACEGKSLKLKLGERTVADNATFATTFTLWNRSSRVYPRAKLMGVCTSVIYDP